MIKDLEVLERYLSQDELKEVAREAAKEAFSGYLREDNKYRQKNYEFFLKQGALIAIQDYISDFDKEKLTEEFTSKISSLIKSLETYQFDSVYNEIAVSYINENKKIITDKIDSLLSDFVNSNNYSTAYSTFQQIVGDSFGDLLNSLLEEKYKKQ